MRTIPTIYPDQLWVVIKRYAHTVWHDVTQASSMSYVYPSMILLWVVSIRNFESNSTRPVIALRVMANFDSPYIKTQHDW